MLDTLASPLYLLPTDMPTRARRICSQLNHTLLAYQCDEGILLHDRRSGMQHLLSWEQLSEMQSESAIAPTMVSSAQT